MPILVTCGIVAAKGGTWTISARVVPAKGVNEYAVKALVADMQQLGHR